MTISSARELVELRTSTDSGDQSRASREEAVDGVWEEVIADYPEMRFWVAQNKTVPLDILRMLARDEDPSVRAMVARKRKLDADLLAALAEDSNDSVRLGIARHPRASHGLLEKLVGDSWSEVREVARNRLEGDMPD